MIEIIPIGNGVFLEAMMERDPTSSTPGT